ncbi:DUF6807 family protein [uncultured Paludibaculum sp.]|uniref:DUF6807 family protein n=1 Tax=uncultured Paludibaculum sp. TaxID=1765020 RepID=UPI002AAB8054|nr:DUF6807 family protein [uncultured Paludibaculum sp.]
MTRIALLALCGSLPLLAADPLEWRDHKDGRVELLENGKTALVYNYGPQLKSGAPEDRRRCCYIFPVLTPAGVSMLDDFPKDHYHHRGVFWAWPVVETGGQKFDIWMFPNLRDRFEKWISPPSVKKTASLAVENGWYAGDHKIVKETVKITAYPAKGAKREFDVELTLEALGEAVTLRGSAEKGKSYGGFSARFAPREQTSILADTGVVAKDEDLVPHAWAELSALYEGKRASLRITPDPKDPGTPYQWCLRPYGFVGASFPGRTETVDGYTLERGKPLTLKFRVSASDAN